MVKKISQNEFNEVTASEVAVIDFSLHGVDHVKC